MNDFASAVMVRVLAEGMRSLGLTPPHGQGPGAGGHARVPLDRKRALVGAALAQAGPAALPLLGRGVHRLRDEPVHEAFANARDARDLLARWSRFERYVHSRHRVVIDRFEDDAGGGRATLRHESQRPPAPLPAEDLVVLGVLAALMETWGLQEVQAWVGDAPALPLPDAAALGDAMRDGRTAAWTLTWRGAGAAARPRSAAMPALPDAATWPEVARDAARLLANDLAHPPRVPDLAERLQHSTRTLQRALARSGLSYSAVLAQTRCRTAAWWLVHTAAPVAEVGFVCGYADQPCFTREFGLRVGLPPAAFRQAFRAAQPAA